MAITPATQISLLAKRRGNNWIQGFGGAFSMLIMQRFWSWQAQFLGNPDMVVVEFAGLSNTDQALATAAGTLWAIIINAPTSVAGWFKGTDNASTCSTNGSQDISIKLDAANVPAETLLLYGRGLILANGFTVRGNTTATGNTTIATANAPVGFCLFGN
jgi:hypothetical protein